MANIGDQLLQPESGWKRITETEILDNSTHDNTWVLYEHSSYYNGKFLRCTADSNELTFYIKSKNFRFISSGGTSRATDCTISINDTTYDANLKNTTGYICLLLEKTNLNDINKIVLRSGTNGDFKFVLDCIDIDMDGSLVTEAEYNKGSKFPVLIGDDTITSETNIANYANTLVNGEKQLLISDKLKSIYVTDGQGSYTKLSDNKDLINDANKSDTTTYSSTKIEQLNTEQTRLLMEKSVYDYNNDGIVNYSDMASVANKIQGIESAPLYSVYGKSPSGVTGFYEIPIGTFDEKDKFQSVRQDVQANVTYTIELADKNELNDFIIQGYEFHPGEQNIVTTLKEFNNTNKDNFFYNENSVVFDSGMSIRNKFSSESVLNSDGINEISMSDFLSIYSIDLEVTK